MNCSIVFYKIGYYAIYILPFLTMNYIFIVKDIKVLIYYINYWIVNHIINTILKNFLKHPRPHNQINIVANDSIYDPYGMPSGHVQHCHFTLSFIWTVCDIKFVICLHIISCLAALQRLQYNKHTPYQILVGGIIGSVIGRHSYLSYENSNKILEL